MAFRDFMAHFSSMWGSSSVEGAALAPLWDALVETSLAIIAESQCPATGLVPNWWVPSNGGSPAAGTTGCSGSDTPAAEFGSEASRTGWRLALGWLWYGDEQSRLLAHRMAAHVTAVLEHYIVPTCVDAACAALRPALWLPYADSSPLSSVVSAS